MYVYRTRLRHCRLQFEISASPNANAPSSLTRLKSCIRLVNRNDTPTHGDKSANIIDSQNAVAAGSCWTAAQVLMSERLRL